MIRFLAVAIATLMLLSRCDSAKPVDQEQSWRAEGKGMGTYYRVIVATPPTAALSSLTKAIEQQMIQDNHQLSTWQADTILSQFNRYQGTDPQPITPGIADIVSSVLRIGARTSGAMDITIGPLVNLWGFGPEKQPSTPPDAQQIKNARARVGLEHLRLIETSKGQWLQKTLPDLYLDLSTVGEGYATDHLATLLEQHGITRYLVSVGGAVLTRGLSPSQKPWRVAIQHPTDETLAAEAIVDLQGHGISTSGNYRNYYELNGKRISHIIDPVTDRPIDCKLVSATVIATTALEADGWDTALMVLGTEKAKQLALRESLAVFLITQNDKGFTKWMSPQFSSFIISRTNNNS
ncbi:MAG: FAD:protein FMN transferase ApbE [Sodalis sp. (in: enterobacteria)]